jgi:hypothetical protein
MKMKVYPEIMEEAFAPLRRMAKQEFDAYLLVKAKSPAMALMQATNITLKNINYQSAVLEEIAFHVIDADFNQDFVRQWSGDMLVKGIHRHLKEFSGEAAANSFITDCWQRASWKKAGRKVYEVSPGLAEHLTNTEVHNVQTEFVNLPFNTICVQVPWQAKLELPGRIADRMIKTHPDSKLVPIGTQAVNCIMVSATVDMYEGIATKVWQVTIVSDGQHGIIDGIPDFACYSFPVPFFEGKTIEDCIKYRRKMVDNMKKELYPDPIWEVYFKWILNFVLYLSYEPAVAMEEIISNKDYRLLKERIIKLPPGEKKKRLNERLRSTPKNERLYVGRGFPRVPTHSEPGSGKPLTVRTMVTGHWRNQAFGTGRQEHKLIWIRPFWRGPMHMEEHNPRRIAT